MVKIIPNAWKNGSSKIYCQDAAKENKHAGKGYEKWHRHSLSNNVKFSFRVEDVRLPP